MELGQGASFSAIAGSSDAEFYAALLGGVLVIVLFAYRQLDRPSYEIDVRQQRLLSLVVPSDLSGSGPFVRAYLFYCALLLSVYLFFCLCVPIVPLVADLSGLGVAGYQADFAGTNSALTPLIVGLIMVGLGPSIPMLNDIEETFRRMAHRLIGIPDNIWDIGQRIQSLEFDASAGEKAEIRASNEAAAISLVAARSFDDGGEELRAALTKILLLRVWLFTPKYSNRWPAPEVRRRFSAFHESVRSDLETLWEEVGHAVKDAEASSASAPAEQASRPEAVHLKARWAAILVQCYAVLNDLSALVSLYAVNSSSLYEIKSDLLRSVITRARSSRQRLILDAMALSMLGIVFFVLIVSLIGARFGFIRFGSSADALWDPAPTAAVYAAATVFLYGPATVVAWYVRTNRLRKMKWQRIFSEGRRIPTLQLLHLALVAYVVTCISMISFDLSMRFINTADKTTVVAEFVRTAAIYKVFIFSLLGTAHAVFTCLWMDLADMKKLNRRSIAVGALAQGLAFAGFTLLGQATGFDCAFAFLVGVLFGCLTGTQLLSYSRIAAANGR